MIANYGYEDGSGSYYIAIDMKKCAICQQKSCINVCLAGLFCMEADDWDNEVVVIRKDLCNTIRMECAGCKLEDNQPNQLPCIQACSAQAIKHSW